RAANPNATPISRRAAWTPQTASSARSATSRASTTRSWRTRCSRRRRGTPRGRRPSQGTLRDHHQSSQQRSDVHRTCQQRWSERAVRARIGRCDDVAVCVVVPQTIPALRVNPGVARVAIVGLLLVLSAHAADADWLFAPFVGSAFGGSTALPDLEQG